ncbi:MAG TPA: hypothetical protein VMY42_19220 [Thermoguttaceae bacterium]|nr:hypothetical protein [Thermoguttaceae bacterium]
MVRPRFIVCSEGRSIDKITNLVTFYNVIDQLTTTISSPEPKQPVFFGLPIHLSAVWMRERDSEKEIEYEAEIRLFSPGSEEPAVLHPDNFRFGQHRFFRIDALIRPGLSGNETLKLELRDGIMRLECRIRPVGETEWLSQDYPIPVRVNRPKSSDAETGSSDE